MKDDHGLTLKILMVCSKMEVPATLKEQLQFRIIFIS